MITVFTPTYNRGYILRKAYESLCNQTCKDFEWVIVDDGSTDDTESLVAGFIKENKINIRYKKVENGGKHLAVNLGVEMAKGEWFIILDSDDYLAPGTVEWIINKGKEIVSNDNFAGISGIRVTPDGRKIGGGGDFGVIDAMATEVQSRYHIKGDLAEVFKTDLLKRYPFPKFEDEKFCPEVLLWNRIAKDGYKMRYLYKGIYVCEYLPDGLSASIVRQRMNSPVASTTCYAEMLGLDIPFLYKVKAAINYWRFKFCPSISKKPKVGIGWALLAPIGLIMHCKDKRTVRKSL